MARAYATPPAGGDRRGRSPRRRRWRRSCAHSASRSPTGVAVQESGREEVAGASGVEHVVDRLGRCAQHVVGCHDEATLGADGDRRRARSRRARRRRRRPSTRPRRATSARRSLPNSRSTSSVTSARKSARWRSTQNESLSVNETSRSLAWATCGRVAKGLLGLGSVVEVALHVQHLDRRRPCRRRCRSGTAATTPRGRCSSSAARRA